MPSEPQPSKPQPTDAPSPQANARMAEQRPVILHLRGTQREMGRQHGELARELGGWQAAMDFYPRMAHRLIYGGLPAEQRNALTYKLLEVLLGFGARQLHHARDPEYRERSLASFEALGLDPRNAACMGVMDIFQNFLSAVSWLGLVGVDHRRMTMAAMPSCSTLMAWGDRSRDGHMLHARNFDFPGCGVWEQAPAVVFCHPDEGIPYGFLSTRGADVPGPSSFNAAGITVTFHTRFHKRVRLRGRSAVDLGHAIVHRARTIEQALAITKSRPIASTWGICISSAREQRAVVVETTGTDVDISETSEHHFFPTANRYHSPRLAQEQLAISPSFLPHCYGRERRMRQMLLGMVAERGPLAAQDLQEILADHHDVDAPERPRGAGSILAQSLQVLSFVSDLQRDQLHLSVGTSPTSWGPYATIDIDWDQPVGYQYLEPDEHAQPHQPITVDPQQAAAQRHYQRASELDMHNAPEADIQRAIELASQTDPLDPSYHFLLAVYAMQEQDLQRAVEELERGRQLETSPFRRAQFELWLSRVLHADGEHERAKTLRDALLAQTRDDCQALRELARDDQRKPPSAARLRRVVPNFMFLDAAI